MPTDSGPRRTPTEPRRRDARRRDARRRDARRRDARRRDARSSPAPLPVLVASLGLAALSLIAWVAASPGAPSAWLLPAPTLGSAGPGATHLSAGEQLPTGMMADPLAEDVELVSDAVASVPPVPPVPPRAAQAWSAAVAAATGVPVTAVQAYGDAALTLGVEQPVCRVGWTTLAAIGAIESGHGSHGGSELRPDGRADPPVIGPALDGVQFAAIPATPESTLWHGDPRWDHAIGPMQFIPSTWERWAADGDLDGVADPHDLDDAALAAGRYLCASGRDLTTGSGWHAAVFSYNHSEAYVADVLARANDYAAAAAAAG